MKAIKYIGICLFIIYIGVFFVSSSSYYDYEAARKTRLTDEQIDYFENEISNGSEVDLTGYISYNDKTYDNLVSNTSLKISNDISHVFNKILSYFFNKMNKIVENK